MSASAFDMIWNNKNISARPGALTAGALKNAGLRDKDKVIVGGAPLTEKYAQQVGADGFAPDAGRAVALAQSLLG